MANGDFTFPVARARPGVLDERDPEEGDEEVLDPSTLSFPVARSGAFGNFNIPLRDRQGPGARFVRGVGRGFIRPVQSLLPGDSEDQEDLGLAGGVGQFIGVLGSFIPAFRGATTALKGVGLLRTGTHLGAKAHFIGRNTQAGRLAAEAARGGLATGAVEAFAGDTPEEAPERFLAGAAFGAAGDVAIMGAINRFRSSFGSWRAVSEAGEAASRDLPVDNEIIVHPEALRIERMMESRASEEELRAVLQARGEPQEQLRGSMLRLVEDFSPRGSVVLPQTDRRALTQITKTLDDLSLGRMSDRYDVEVSRPFEGEDLFDVWIIDKGRQVLEAESQAPATSRILAALEERFPKIDAEFPDFLQGDPEAWGRWQQFSQKVQVRSEEPSPLGIATTLMHESFHAINQFAQKLINGGSATPRSITRSIYDSFRGLDEVPEGYTFGNFEGELREMTARAYIQKTEGPGARITQEKLDDAENFLQTDFESTNPYFWSDREINNWALDYAVNNAEEADELYTAHRLLYGVMDEFAPQFSSLLRPETRLPLRLLEDRWKRTSEGDFSVFREGTPIPDEAARAEFRRFGWAPGMPAYLDGKTVNIVRRVDPPGKFVVRSLDDGTEQVVGVDRLQRAGLPWVAKQDARVSHAIDTALDQIPRTLPVQISRTVDGVPATARAILDTEGFIRIDTDVRTWMRGLPEGVRNQLRARHGQIRPRELDSMGGAQIGALDEPQGLALLDDALDLTGSNGLIRNDGGVLTVYTREPETTLTIGEEVSGGLEAGEQVSSSLTRIFNPAPDDIIRHQLRTAGVAEADMPFFFEQAKRRFGDRVLSLADGEARQVSENVKMALDAPAVGVADDVTVGMDGPEATLARAGMDAEVIPSGRVLVRDRRSRAILAEVVDEDEAVAYANDVTVEGVGPDLGDFPGGAATGNGGAAPPPRPQDPLIPSTPRPPDGSASRKVRRGWWTNLESTLFGGKHFTALENVAKKFENLGLGPAYTGVYLPLNNAMLRVNRELSEVKRSIFGGLTFKDKFDELNDAMVGIGGKRRPLVSGWVEAATKDEIRQPGGLMQRAMTGRELEAARFFESSGLQHDIPELMSTIRLIDGHLEGKLTETIRKMEQIQLSPEAQRLVQIFKTEPQFTTADEAMDFLGLTDEQWQGIKIIRDSRQADLDKFSIYAVSRYASAPTRRKGFASGREQFAFDNQMTERELTAAKIADETLRGAFEESGLDPKRFLSGYWPHLRKWVGSGGIVDAEHFPDDVRQWVATRYRAGELNVYERDPLLSAYRHVRGLYMNRHFDPEMPRAMEAIQSLAQTDSRAADVMQEYAMELSGRPHTSYENVEGMINSSMKALLGRELEPGFARGVVNGMATLTSAALLPFRPALIARNYFESLLKVAPRVGMSSYVKAVRYVNNPATRKEAWKAAMDGGAIRPGIAKLRSVHQADEIFTPGSSGLGVLGRAQRIFDKGFEWYQHPDDWGRAVAFHAQRLRAAPHLDDFQQGRISMSELLDRAKVNTYDPLDVELVEEQFRNKNFKQALDHLGRTLSRESMTRYGYADHPVGWNSVAGRLFGQFGTWPVQYKDYVIQGLTRGSTKDKAEFMLLHGGISGGVMAAGASVGLDLQSWTGFSSPYTGGPYADLVVDISKSLNGSDAEKTLARSNLEGQIPVWGWMRTGNPRSVFLPGSFVLGDIASAAEAMQDGEVFESLMSGAGVRTLRADEPRPLEWLYGP